MMYLWRRLGDNYVRHGRVALPDSDPFPSGCYVKVPGTGFFASGVYIGGGIVLTAAHVACLSQEWAVGLPSLKVGVAHEFPVKAVRSLVPYGQSCHGRDLALLVLEERPAFRGPVPLLGSRAVYATMRSRVDDVSICGFGFGGTRDEVDADRSNSLRHGIKRFGNDVPIRFDSIIVAPKLGFDPAREFVAGPRNPGDGVSDVCVDDSGGPAYWTDVDGKLWLVGIASRNIGPHGECGYGSIFTRIDVNEGWIRGVALRFGADV